MGLTLERNRKTKAKPVRKKTTTKWVIEKNI